MAGFDTFVLAAAGNFTIPSGTTTQTLPVPAGLQSFDLKLVNVTNNAALMITENPNNTVTVTIGTTMASGTTGMLQVNTPSGVPTGNPNFIVADYQQNGVSELQQILPLNDLSNGVLTWTPSSNLAVGTYTVYVTFDYAQVYFTASTSYTAVLANNQDVVVNYAFLIYNTDI